MTATSPASTQLLHRLWRGLAWALHILLVALLVLVAVQASNGWACVGIAVFIVTYAGGLPFIARRAGDIGQPMGGGAHPWPVWLWLVAVCAAWLFMAIAEVDAAFVAFPLFFVLVRFLRPLASGVAIVLLTLAVVAVLAVHLEAKNSGAINLGAMVGPIIGAGVAWVLGVGFRLLYAEAQARAEAMDALVAARAEALAASRRAGETDERARLAGEIHDTVAQGLSSIHMLLSAVESSLPAGHEATAAQQIALAKQTASDNLTETRRIIAALQPAPLTSAELPVALARICSSTPLGADLRFDIDGSPRQLPPEVENTIVRVTQSLISNVVRHSGGSGRVTLTYHPECVSVDVVDNGTGFDPQQVDLDPQGDRGRTSGLAGVNTRVRSLGGHMTVESSVGGGTGVSVSIPASTSDRTPPQGGDD
ncbi:sensor histidine kinase [Corynebacterium heidelbergense]|uniref:Oxygen sensor histidine kinase NreB n=1 Tax=Corynebacterium heidelbergense TaxID=2055947 RepID=A0A364V415_9CORY|nr:sensor histidine kinase [Corynebacterium heidelbergense]RAV31385.1 sensor histidine kinase [Corynebacterium heidelbergense]